MQGPLGPALKQARLKKKLSQRQLAKLLGISHSTVDRVERGVKESLPGKAYLPLVKHFPQVLLDAQQKADQ
jgi:transcriptional regulator with XRE-family HTH domain